MKNPFRKASIKPVTAFFSQRKKAVTNFVNQKPWPTFFAVLLILFGVIFLSHFLRTPEVISEESTLPPKKVTLFTPQNDSITLTVPAQIKKNSIITVRALTSGVVSSIYVAPGQSVGRGHTLLSLTNDYGSGASSVEKEIARNNAALQEEVYNLDQKIQSLDERRIKKDDTLSGSQEDVELARLKKDRELRRYALTDSRLNLSLALKNDAVLQPKSSLPGVITSIAVRRGQFVNAGDTLATLTATGTTSTLEALISADTAWLIDPTKKANLILSNGDTIPLTLEHLASQENEAGLYSVVFSLPLETAQKLTDGFYTDIEISLKSQGDNILLPLESVFQNTSSAWVMIAKDGVAKAEPVTLGKILGNYIEITSGISSDTAIILSRGIIEGEAIVTE